MHYSKENKALYDQQKAAKKAKNDAQKQAQANQNVKETQVKSMVITAIKFQM